MPITILVISSGLTHPGPLARFFLRRGLAAFGYQVQGARSLEDLPNLDLATYKAAVLFAHHETVSAAALEKLDLFVSDGGGLLALHAASASYGTADQWLRIMGGRFKEHGPVESFRVEPVEEDDEVFGGIPAFTIRDELYRHVYDHRCRFHFATRVGGEAEPVVWTRYWGVGRVCYCALGHTWRSVRHPQVREILGRGLDWVCGVSTTPQVAR